MQPQEIKCMECKHFEKVKINPLKSKRMFSYICLAFLKKIPLEIRSWEKPHKKVREDQKGKFIFESIK